jgi:hypothetical protein
VSWKFYASAVLATGLAACAASQPDAAAAQWRVRLREAMQVSVTTREQRAELSRVLVDAVAHDALEALTLADVQANFGQGFSCEGNALCAEHGFTDDDLYFPIGDLRTDKIKQLPVLVVGFDTHGHVQRVYTLRTD